MPLSWFLELLAILGIPPAYRCRPQISVTVFTWTSSLCVCVSVSKSLSPFSYKDTSHWI